MILQGDARAFTIMIEHCSGRLVTGSGCPGGSSHFEKWLKPELNLIMMMDAWISPCETIKNDVYFYGILKIHN